MSSESGRAADQAARQASDVAAGEAADDAAGRRRPRRATRPAGDPSRPDRPAVASLPGSSADDTDLGEGDWREATRDDDDRILRERPPHW